MNPVKKKQQQKFVDQNPIEAIRDSGGSSTFSDQIKPTPDNFFEQLLGLGSYKNAHSGDLSEGQAIDFKALQAEKAKKPEIEGAIDYRREILHADKKANAEDSQEIQMQIEQILTEIKKLVSASAELKIQYKQVMVEKAPKKAGKYELAFFEWLLSSIQLARLRVEESSNWLQMFASRKKQKQYWNQFKKHGTTFGLSNERVVATQTG